MPRLALALFLSGAAALACETVWLRMLTRVFGVTVHAVAALTSLYMLGLGLGALLAPRLKGRPGKIYALLEAGAALGALLTAYLNPFFLFPTTVLLGATLPVVARSGSPRLLYAANTAGACAGALLAGFWTLGTFGETATIAGTALISLLAAALGWPARGPAAEEEASKLHWMLGAYALSGFCALGFEVLLTRQLIPLLGNSVYAFTLILAAYLLGLSLGAALAPKRLTFGVGQLLVCAAALLALLLYTALALLATSPDFLYTPIRDASHFLLVTLEALVLVFPLAFALGMLWPAALRTYPSVGPLYAANTAGAILGSLFAGFVGIKLLGAWNCFLLLAALSGALGLSLTRSWQAALLLGAGFVLVRADPTLPMLKSRLSRHVDIRFHDDTPAATVTGYGPKLSRSGGLLINGIETAGTGPPGTLMALIPHLLMEKAGKTLVICFGAGNTFRAASMLGHETDAVDLVPALFERMPAFYPDAAAHLSKPTNRLFAEDGRRQLLKSDKLYDLIVVDAAPPLFSAGAVNLYTREFLELAKSRLTEDGLMTLWLPLPAFEEDYWRILSAYTSVFPHSATWRIGDMMGVLVFGSRKPLSRPKGWLDRRLKTVPPELKFGITEEKFNKALMLSGEPLRLRAAKWPPLSDDKPVVEFPLPRFLRKDEVHWSAPFLLK
jgi:predicted membrane-bound spermidine synthase